MRLPRQRDTHHSSIRRYCYLRAVSAQQAAGTYGRRFGRVQPPCDLPWREPAVRSKHLDRKWIGVEWTTAVRLGPRCRGMRTVCVRTYKSIITPMLQWFDRSFSTNFYLLWNNGADEPAKRTVVFVYRCLRSSVTKMHTRGQWRNWHVS
jgi:hypothetical protein